MCNKVYPVFEEAQMCERLCRAGRPGRTEADVVRALMNSRLSAASAAFSEEMASEQRKAATRFAAELERKLAEREREVIARERAQHEDTHRTVRREHASESEDQHLPHLWIGGRRALIGVVEKENRTSVLHRRGGARVSNEQGLVVPYTPSGVRAAPRFVHERGALGSERDEKIDGDAPHAKHHPHRVVPLLLLLPTLHSTLRFLPLIKDGDVLVTSTVFQHVRVELPVPQRIGELIVLLLETIHSFDETVPQPEAEARAAVVKGAGEHAHELVIVRCAVCLLRGVVVLEAFADFGESLLLQCLIIRGHGAVVPHKLCLFPLPAV